MSKALPASLPSTQLLGLLAPLVLGAYLLITSTAQLSDSIWPYDVKRIIQLYLLPLLFCIVLFNRQLRDAFGQQLARIPLWLGALLLTVMALGVASSLYNSPTPMSLLYSLSEVALLTLWVMAVIAVAAFRQIAGRLFDKIALIILAMVGTAVALQELLGVLAAWSSGVEFHPRIALLHFSHPRFYNQVQSWSIPLIAALPLVFPGKPMVKYFCVLTLILEWYVVIATGGRGTALAVGTAILGAAIFIPSIRKRIAIYQLLGLGGGVLLYLTIVLGHQTLQPAGSIQQAAGDAGETTQIAPEIAPDANYKNLKGPEQSGSFSDPVTGPRIWTSSGRIRLWKRALSDAKSNPILGIGPINNACTTPIFWEAHPHSFVFQILSEWGIPAFILLFSAIAYLLLQAFRKVRTPATATDKVNPQLIGYIATGIVAALIHACLSGVMNMPASQVCGVLVAGWFLGLTHGHTRTRRAATGVIAAGIALLLSVGLLFFAHNEVSLADERLEQTPVMDRAIPRFWQNGKACRLAYEEELAATRL